MNPLIFHIDVNSAYLSWTSVENLRTGTGIDLREIPSIIGGDRQKRHGVVLAKSLKAKSYGIHTGEAISTALKKYPDLVIAPPEHDLYALYSKRLMDYLKNLTPDIEQVSVDECYLNFAGISHIYEGPLQAAASIRDNILQKFGFTVNIGISNNKLLAKMASDFEKPGKIHTLFSEEIQQKMWPLPLNNLYMAGKSSVETLKKLGINSIGDLALTDPNLLTPHLKSHGRLLWEYANGLDDSPMITKPEPVKGIGNRTTLSRDAATMEEAIGALRPLAESVSSRLREASFLAGNVCVELKYSTFISASHQMPFTVPTNSSNSIYDAACILFEQLWDKTPVRLLGIRCSKLMETDTPIQLSIFDLPQKKNEKQQKMDQAFDQIRKKYGQNAITRASMLKT